MIWSKVISDKMLYQMLSNGEALYALQNNVDDLTELMGLWLIYPGLLIVTTHGRAFKESAGFLRSKKKAILE